MEDNEVMAQLESLVARGAKLPVSEIARGADTWVSDTTDDKQE
mgnify:CR=1 FL=1